MEAWHPLPDEIVFHAAGTPLAGADTRNPEVPGKGQSLRILEGLALRGPGSRDELRRERRGHLLEASIAVQGGVEDALNCRAHDRE